ncbi:MAG: T9SS type A sorting domain-containing protein [Ignavibacteriales bacterium]|nr:T9SS type A sorting domain-containing protein [Ignavibacteriales bacterium]
MRQASVLGVLAFLLFLPLNLHADVFASGIRFTNPDDSPFDGSVTDGTGLKVHFLLNDTAATVAVRIHRVSDDGVVHTINLLNLSAGWQSAEWDGTGAAGGQLYVTIEASQSPYSSSSYTMYRFIITRGTDHAIFSRGVDPVRNQSKENFGYLYVSNAGGPLLRGITRYDAAGGDAGTNPDSPMLLPSLAASDGGTIPWTIDLYAPVHATTDMDGRVYACDHTRGEVWRMDNDTTAPRKIITVSEPRGLAVRGSGTDLKLYVAAGTYVLRANMGTDDTLTTQLDTVASLETLVRDVVFDDEGYMYVNLRTGTGFDGTAGVATERYNITGTLPVIRANAVVSFGWNGLPAGIARWGGSDPNTADDDILYISVRSNATADLPGVYRIADINNPFTTPEHLFKPDDVPGGLGGDISTRADLTVDPAGNVVFFENGNEEIIFLARPSSASSVSYTTKSASTIDLGPTSVETLDKPYIPKGYLLEQNFPNPFNPSTTIQFTIRERTTVSLRVFDALGREVRTLVTGEYDAGSYQTRFDAGSLPSGVYFFTLSAGAIVETRKMILMR